MLGKRVLVCGATKDERCISNYQEVNEPLLSIHFKIFPVTFLIFFWNIRYERILHRTSSILSFNLALRKEMFMWTNIPINDWNPVSQTLTKTLFYNTRIINVSRKTFSRNHYCTVLPNSINIIEPVGPTAMSRIYHKTINDSVSHPTRCAMSLSPLAVNKGWCWFFNTTELGIEMLLAPVFL